MVSRISSKGQVTIPAKVRNAIGLKSGDFVAYEVHENTVLLRRIEPIDVAFHRALGSTLEEWNSKEDEEAFRDL